MFCSKCGSELHNSEKFCGKCGAAVLSLQTAQPTHLNRKNKHIIYFIVLLFSCLGSIALTFAKWLSIPIAAFFTDYDLPQYSVFDALINSKDFFELLDGTKGTSYLYITLLLMWLVPILNAVSIYKLSRLASRVNHVEQIASTYRFTRMVAIISGVLSFIFIIVAFATNSYASSQFYGFIDTVFSVETAPWLLLLLSAINFAVSTKAQK